jgi:hypothetical protein
MRAVAAWPLVAAFALSAVAAEVPLTPRELAADSVRMMEGNGVRFEAAEMPAGAKAPAGDLRWGKLHAGTPVCWVCWTLAGEGAFYADADGDLDLGEEKPVRFAGTDAAGRVFRVPGIAGEFGSGEAAVKASFTLQFDPEFSPDSGMVFSATVYEGRASAGGAEFVVSWVPGGPPALGMPPKILEQVPARKLVAGGRSVALREALAGRDGKVVAVFDESEGKDLVSAPVPADTCCVVLMVRGEDAPDCTILLPGGGKCGFPRGEGQEAVLVLRKADAAGVFFDLLVQMQALNVGDGFAPASPLPLSFAVSAESEGSERRFRYACKDAAGREVMICRDGGPAPMPALEIQGPDGKAVATHQFEAG